MTTNALRMPMTSSANRASRLLMVDQLVGLVHGVVERAIPFPGVERPRSVEQPLELLLAQCDVERRRPSAGAVEARWPGPESAAMRSRPDERSPSQDVSARRRQELTGGRGTFRPRLQYSVVAEGQTQGWTPARSFRSSSAARSARAAASARARAANFLSGKRGFLTASTRARRRRRRVGHLRHACRTRCDRCARCDGARRGATGATGAVHAAADSWRGVGDRTPPVSPPTIAACRSRCCASSVWRCRPRAPMATLLPAERALILSHAREAGVESVVEDELAVAASALRDRRRRHRRSAQARSLRARLHHRPRRRERHRRRARLSRAARAPARARCRHRRRSSKQTRPRRSTPQPDTEP